MIVQKNVISIGQNKPLEKVVTDNSIIIRSNFERVEPCEDHKGLSPQMNGYRFTETVYSPSEYISQLDGQITDLQLAVAELYEQN